MDDIFAADHAPMGEPYWWQKIVRVADASIDPGRTYDAAIIGSGFTGLTAALELAGAGQSVIVIDAEIIGYGASTRNGGMLTPQVGQSYAVLARAFGPEVATNMHREAAGLVDFVESQLGRYGIDADFQRRTSFTGAITEAHFRHLEASISDLEQAGLTLELVPPGGERRYIRTDYYRGGRAFHNCGAVHPAKYHGGLVKAAVESGVLLVQKCRVNNIRRRRNYFELATGKSNIRAQQVVIATNGYDSKASGWHRRRIVPILSSIIATEPLGRERMDTLLPGGTIIGDTRRILSYYRPSPDGTRLLYGGRASFQQISEVEIARRLRAKMLQVFPKIEDVKISHTWSGFVGFTFDHLPHTGRHEGIDYAMGYNGSGVAMGSWLGHRVARRMLGEEPSAFEAAPFKTIPGYTGNPWILPLIGDYYRMRDWLERKD